MSLFLAFDVGGSKTAALLADEERVLARAQGGSIKTLRLLPAEAEINLRDVLRRLEETGGRSLRGAVTRTCIGTSGISAPSVRRWMESAIAEHVGGELRLVGDEVIGLDAAFPGGRGVLVIAGTGSNIVGRAADGRMAHCGGWGPALADEGSGHWIGREALRACFRAIDSALPSSADAVLPDRAPAAASSADLPALLNRFLDVLGLPDVDAMIGAANAPGFHSAELVPAVVSAALAGDAIALGVLRRAGADLAELVSFAIGKVRVLEGDPQAPPPEVACVGSVLNHIAEVRTTMIEHLETAYPGIRVREGAVDPLDGALWQARGAQLHTEGSIVFHEGR